MQYHNVILCRLLAHTFDNVNYTYTFDKLYQLTYDEITTIISRIANGALLSALTLLIAQDTAFYFALEFDSLRQ